MLCAGFSRFALETAGHFELDWVATLRVEYAWVLAYWPRTNFP